MTNIYYKIRNQRQYNLYLPVLVTKSNPGVSS